MEVNKELFKRFILIPILQFNNCLIVFTKKDGSERTMFCTRKEHFNNENVAEILNEEGNNISVYDIEKKGYRSFNIDSLISFKIDLSDDLKEEDSNV